MLLDQVLQARQDERSIPLKDDDAFELFACEQVLRDRDLSADEVALGVVGGGNDGAMETTVAQYRALMALASQCPQRIADLTRALGVMPSRAGGCVTGWCVRG